MIKEDPQIVQKMIEYAKSPKTNRDRNVNRSRDFIPEKIANEYIKLFH